MQRGSYKLPLVVPKRRLRYLRGRVSVVASAMGLATLLFGSPPGIAYAACVRNAHLTLDDYLKLTSPGNDILSYVPHDLKVVPGRGKYIADEDLPGRVLPSTQAGILYHIQALGKITPICEVQTPDSQWWLVQRHVDGFLSYLPKAGTELLK